MWMQTILLSQKKKNIVDKIFLHFLSLLFDTLYHYMKYHVSWSLNTVSRIAELQPKVTISLAQIPYKLNMTLKLILKIT